MVSREREENLTLFVDHAAGNKIHPEKQKAWLEDKGNFVVVLQEACRFNLEQPDLEALIQEKPESFKWYDSNADIALKSSKIKEWQYCPLTLDVQINPSGNLSLRATLPNFQAWLERPDKEVVYQGLVRLLLPNTNAPLLNLTWQEALEVGLESPKIPPSAQCALVWDSSLNLKIPHISYSQSAKAPNLQDQCLELPMDYSQEDDSCICLYTDFKRTQEILYGDIPYYYNNNRYETTCFVKKEIGWDWENFWTNLLEIDNIDIYIFKARFVGKATWINALFKTNPHINLQGCLELSRQIQETWREQDMRARAWLEHLPLLNDSQDLELAKKLVGGKIPWAKLTPHFQKELANKALQNKPFVFAEIQAQI